MKNRDVVTASEIGEYVYCQRQWWLRLNDYLQGNTYAMDLGTKKHNQLANNLASYSLKKIIAISFILLSLILISLVLATLIL